MVAAKSAGASEALPEVRQCPQPSAEVSAVREEGARVSDPRKKLEPVIAVLQQQIDALCEVAGDPPASTIRAAAQSFCRMNDDQQAQFFVVVAEIMGGWKGGSMSNQAYYIGKHLRDCECSTEAARDFVRSISVAIEQ